MNTEMSQKKQKERDRKNVIIKYTNHNGVNVCCPIQEAQVRDTQLNPKETGVGDGNNPQAES